MKKLYKNYIKFAFDAILIYQDEDRAIKYLEKLNDDQLQDLADACNWLAKLAKQVLE